MYQEIVHFVFSFINIWFFMKKKIHSYSAPLNLNPRSIFALTYGESHAYRVLLREFQLIQLVKSFMVGTNGSITIDILV